MYSPSVSLPPAVGPVAEQLVRRAVDDADPDDVTPPLAPGWAPERLAWLRDYLTRCSGGLDEAGEAVWAVTVDGEPVGAVRLQRTDEAGTLETGIWLGRSVRGQGLAVEALAAVVERAWALGAERVHAETSRSNASALATLLHLGFETSGAPRPERVRGSLSRPAPPFLERAM